MNPILLLLIATCPITIELARLIVRNLLTRVRASLYDVRMTTNTERIARTYANMSDDDLLDVFFNVDVTPVEMKIILDECNRRADIDPAFAIRAFGDDSE